MIGLSDIPCVGKIVDRISDATVAALFRGLRYIFYYKALVNDLNSEIGKLNIKKDKICRKAEEERNNGKIINNDVLTWQKEVEEIQKSGTEFASSWRCISCLPIPDPISRFRQGRDAVQKAKVVIDLNGCGTNLLASEIAYLPPNENLPKTNTEFQNFQSRKIAYEKLWEELVIEGGSVGIYGMPGVGKTNMMHQIWKEVVEKNIFDKVTLAVVGNEELNVINLQKQIASHLGCQLESEDDKKHRANQLKNSLKNGGKILFILDDVWSVIPLIDIIGTSFSDDKSWKGCKILLTSREISVCLKNNCKHPVEIRSLTDDEALDLFNNTLGTNYIDSLPDESLVQEVCNKCAGLPLVIIAIGKALRFMPHNIWKDALEQLKDHEIESVPGISPEVYACLKLSFDTLPEDAKRCLLLCSLFPEDADIHISKLIQLATGSYLVTGGRSRVRAMVDFVKYSSLLLEGKDDQHFKLHDIIRDVAISIAVKDPKYAFLFARCSSWLPCNADYSTRKLLHLDLDVNDFHCRDDLACPDLNTLWLQPMAMPWPKRKLEAWLGNSMFGNLRLLVLVNFYSQWQFTLQTLGNLKTLLLNCCDISYIAETDVGFFPENLETLCIWDCHLPKLLLIPNLKYLRKLEIHGWVQVAPNTISSLSSLEELHFPDGCRIWDDARDRVVPIWEEISKLTSLTSLQIKSQNFKPSQDIAIFSNLLEFNICVGAKQEPKSTNVLPVSLMRSIDLYGGNDLEVFQTLIGRAEEVLLFGNDVKVSSIYNSNREAFADLRNLEIENCNTMEHVARISQDWIWHIFQPRTSFSKLIRLNIKGCCTMKYLFCNAVANCLVQLQELCIIECPAVEAIVMNEHASNGDIIKFFKLKKLVVTLSPRVASFYKANSAIDSVQFLPLFNEMVAFPSLERLELSNLEDLSHIWGNHYYDIDNVYSFCKLKHLEVSSCDKLPYVIPIVMLHKLKNLEYLKVTHCNLLVSELGTYDNNTVVGPLAALRDMHLKGLPSLTKTGLNSSWEHSGSLTNLYPNLKKLKIQCCRSLRNVFLPSTARDLIHLKEFLVRYCNEMREIIQGEGEQQEEITDDRIIVFPELTRLQLIALPNLTGLCEANTYEVELPNLVDFKLSFVQINLEGIKLGRYDSTCQLRSLHIGYVQLPLAWQLRFQRLKVLQLNNSGCSTLFTFSAFESLQHLEEIIISDCASLEKIVDDSRCDEPSGMDKKKTITLSKLNTVILSDLPKLKSFLHGTNYECHMPALMAVGVYNCGLLYIFTISALRSLQKLQELKISNCVLLEEIVEDVWGDEASGMDRNTVTLFQLRSVLLIDLPKLKSFINSVNYECHMPALKEVKVNNCGLSILFTCSVSRNLGQLKNLLVWNCRLLEGIVGVARAEGISDTDEKIITFFCLLSISLINLPNLKSFSRTVSYAINMPRLNHLNLLGCPRVENFTCSKTSTTGPPVHVSTDWGRGRVSDLNDYIRQNLKERKMKGRNLNDIAGESSNQEH